MRLLSVEQVRELVPFSRPKMNRMIVRGEFVQPLQVGQSLMFVEEEIREWIAAQPRGLFSQAPALKRYQADRKKGGSA